MSREEADRLQDILDRISAARAAESVLERAERDGDARAAAVALDAILYDLVVIGEAVKHLPTSAKLRRPEVPWRAVAGMRDVLAHSYFEVSSAVVRSTLDEPLSALREACLALQRRRHERS